MSTALVLGAGGVVGRAYLIGTVAALADAAGWDAREAGLIIGTSAGSGTGSTLRVGLSPADHRARLCDGEVSPEGTALIGEVSPSTDFPSRPPRGPEGRRPQAPHLLLRGLAPPWPARVGVGLSGLLPRGTVPTAPLGEKVRALYGDRWPADPLWVCAVRVSDGARVVFGRDPIPGTFERPDLATAIEASSAIPGYFAPVDIGGHLHMDGAVHSPTNADLAAGLGFDGVVVISPMSAVGSALRWHPRSAARAAFHHALQREVRSIGADGTKALVFEPTADDLPLMGGAAMDHEGEAEIVARAYASAISLLDRLDITDLAEFWAR